MEAIVLIILQQWIGFLKPPLVYSGEGPRGWRFTIRIHSICGHEFSLFCGVFLLLCIWKNGLFCLVSYRVPRVDNEVPALAWHWPVFYTCHWITRPITVSLLMAFRASTCCHITMHVLMFHCTVLYHCWCYYTALHAIIRLCMSPDSSLRFDIYTILQCIAGNLSVKR